MGNQTDTILVEQFLTNHPRDAARIIENLKTAEIVQLLNTMPEKLAGRAVSHLNIDTSVHYLQMISIEKTVAIIDTLPFDFVSLLIKRMPKDIQEKLLELISPETASFLNITLNYPEETIGAMMDPFVFTLCEDITVGEAMKRLQKQTEFNLYYIYILTSDHKLTGVLSITEIFRSKATQVLSSVMTKKVVKILVDIHYKLILKHPGWQDFHVLPVVDNNDIFQGIIEYSVLRRFEDSKVEGHSPKNLTAASSALGELYRLGIASLIHGASDIYNEPKSKI